MAIHRQVCCLNPSEDGKVLVLEVPDIEVYRNLEIWLASFFPIQTLCLRTFEDAKGIATNEAVACFGQFRGAFDEVFKVYRESLRQMKADILADLH
jgi:hypothetical protein